ncbi:hypothetical protein VNO77_04637 [Canavalia gladiata]|uniref:Uncharacterized protein n=1 Tax=Canavalia gladiata TaxID=3824 RepID=A0AAN9MXN5_CANGL
MSIIGLRVLLLPRQLEVALERRLDGVGEGTPERNSQRPGEPRAWLSSTSDSLFSHRRQPCLLYDLHSDVSLEPNVAYKVVVRLQFPPLSRVILCFSRAPSKSPVVRRSAGAPVNTILFCLRFSISYYSSRHSRFRWIWLISFGAVCFSTVTKQKSGTNKLFSKLRESSNPLGDSLKKK